MTDNVVKDFNRARRMVAFKSVANVYIRGELSARLGELPEGFDR